MAFSKHIRNIFASEAAISGQAPSMDQVLLLIVFFATLFVPDLSLTSSMHIGWEEFLVPLMFLRLIWVRFYRWDFLVWTLAFLFLVISMSIFKNGQYADVRNLFELYKVLKMCVVYVFAFYVFRLPRFQYRFYEFLQASFIVLVLINLLHLFDVFSINHWLITWYDYDGRDAATFGLNSLGEPDSRRIIGTMGNPNDNAILFLFFLICFVVRQVTQVGQRRRFLIAGNEWNILICSLLIFLCQSRTGIVAFGLLVLIGLRYAEWSWKKLVFSILILLSAVFLLDLMVQQHAMKYLSNTRLQLDQNNSVSSRFEIWKRLFNMWKEKPILGFGPNKEFIYQEKIYPESEYIYYLWRYGILGLLSYLLLVIGVLVQGGRSRFDRPMPLMLVILLGVTALTNNPLTNPKFLVIFAIGWGLAANPILFEKTEIQSRA
jgi:O-antigen ligase